jgi:hypothetical protein
MHFRPPKFWRFKSRTSENGAVKAISPQETAGSAENRVTPALDRPISNHDRVIDAEQRVDDPTQTDHVRVSGRPFPPESDFSSSKHTESTSPELSSVQSHPIAYNGSVPEPWSPRTRDAASSETMKWAVRCKVGLEHFDRALAGVPVPGLKAAVGSVALIIEKLQVYFTCIFIRGSTEGLHR